MWLNIGLGVLTGLGLLLFGIQMMATGLQKAAGNRLRVFVAFLTKNRLLALLVGMIITIIIHSSAATSVMVVGFVNSGIMTLQQGVGVIMGANIGTTITGQLLSFNIAKFAPVVLVAGLILQLTGKTTKKRNFAEVLIGLGILFIGMSLLKEAMNPLKGYPKFEEYLVRWGTNPIPGISLGIVITMLMQSSAATIAILIALGSEGILPLEAALYIIYGDNIGTCATAVISSIGSSINARRIALIHLLFNIIGTAIFLLFVGKPLAAFVKYLNPGDVARQVANSHSLFNIINVIILFPAANLLVKLATFIIPDKGEDSEFPLLDRRFFATPAIALKNAVSESIVMIEMAKESLENAILAYRTRDKEYIEKSNKLEAKINNTQREIMAYLQNLSALNLSNHDRLILDALFNTVSDIERIGDHADNIAELSNTYIDKEVEFSEESTTEMRATIDHIYLTLETLIETMVEGDTVKARRVLELEEEMDEMEKTSRHRQIERMNSMDSSIESGIIFLDLLSNLERVSDHANNIAQSIIFLEDKAKLPVLQREV
ncbi:MAG: Na/Pi cotransporter family protein [Tissierellia bacterium]|nr:Na/Pi cotransporter family protein [Tissierellia bacterium]